MTRFVLVMVLAGGIAACSSANRGVPFDPNEPAATAAARMADVHGGMDAWRAARTVTFTDHWVRTGGESDLRTRVVLERTTLRAHLDVLGGDTQMAFDGEKAWGLNWDLTLPPRFFIHLNYLLLHLPWLANEEGAELGERGTRKLWNGSTFETMKVKLSDARGDLPIEVLILFLDPRTHRLAGCEYSVIYAGVLPPPLNRSPTLLLLYEDYLDKEGLVVPERYTVYNPDRTRFVTCRVEDWELSDTFDDSLLVMPPAAVVDSSLAVRR
jgi:hypothetical protein